MICLTVCNHKGGTGKTTSTMNLAAAMGLTGHRVLVVDLDPQGFLTRMMGQSEAPAESSSLAMFDEHRSANDVEFAKLPAFDLVKSSPALSTAIRRLTKPTDVLWLRDFREAIQDRYDVLLFDTAAAITVFSLNALVAADHVLIPVLPEYQPVVGGEQTYQTAQIVRKRLNPGMKSARFLLTMVDGRKKNHLAYRKYLRDRYEHRVLQTVIRTCTALSLTKQDGATVFETDPRARGSIDYAGAADELLQLFASYPSEGGAADPATPDVEPAVRDLAPIVSELGSIQPGIEPVSAGVESASPDIESGSADTEIVQSVFDRRSA